MSLIKMYRTYLEYNNSQSIKPIDRNSLNTPEILAMRHIAPLINI
jgi:hypothetical protein